MAVPSSNSEKRNTTGGVFVHAKQGGTILNNNNTTVTNSVTGDGIITKAFELDDAVDDNSANKYHVLPLPGVSGIYGHTGLQTPLSGGTFGYSAAGKYVIARASDTLSGVSKTQLLFMGSAPRNNIHQFQGDLGAKLLTAWRQNQWSWLHRLDSGAAITNMRINWVNAAGTAAASPDSLNGVNMWAPGGAARNGTGALADFTDSAANPTRSIPGRLVMKANFVNLNTWTADKTTDRPDFYVYKPITGM